MTERDPRSTEELVRAALQGDEDDEQAWAAIRVLHWRGTRDVLESAQRLLHAPTAKERARGADILGQLGANERTFPRECGDLLLDLLRRETEPAVLSSAAVALGHLREERAAPDLVRLAVHPNADVRLGVVHGLFDQHAPEAIDALITLSADEDRDVRSWATFELGTILDDVDTPRLRDALANRLADEDSEVFGEALVGLGLRKDPRVVEHVRAALTRDTVDVYALEAAGHLEDPSFYPLLLALRASPGDADPYFQNVLDDVISKYQRSRQP